MEEPGGKITLENAMASVQAKSESFPKGNVWTELGNEIAQALGSDSLATLVDEEAVAHAMEKFTKLHNEIAKELGYEDAADMSAKVLADEKAKTSVQ